MTAAEITPKYYNKQTNIPVVGRLTKVAQSDWIVLPYPGVSNFRANNYAGGSETTLTYGTAAISNAGTAYTALTKQLVLTTAKITRKPPYYLQTTSGELIFVYIDSDTTSAAPTVECIRGCLGTTASATGIANGNTVYIKNIVILGQSSTGITDFSFTPMPFEPKGSEFT
jgi:hypothetical protein